MDDQTLHYCMFMVDDKPYCVWDWDFSSRTLLFLKGIDPSYFEYLANTHKALLETEQHQHAAIAIRTAYAQGLETFFALVGAALQAPHCVPAWLTKYTNQDLENLVDKIRNQRSIYTVHGFRSWTWKDIVTVLHENLVLEDKQKEQTIKDEFAQLWGRFSRDFMSEKARREYNNIKHGLRVQPGGFSVAIGLEEQPGLPAPTESMRLMGQSKYGSAFLIPENITGAKETKHHFRLKRQSLNWNPEDMIYGLMLISTSIHNILAYLKVLNGVEAQDVRFQWPSDHDTYQEPWKRSRQIGFSSFGWPEVPIAEEHINKYSKDEIRAIFEGENSTSPTDQQAPDQVEP